MRTLRFALITLALVPNLGSTATAANPGEAAYAFLKIGTDARSEAMGGAMTAVADQLGAVFYNPAALAATTPRSVTASYTNWLTDIQTGSLAGAWGVGANGRLGLAIHYVDYGEFDPRDALGNPGADFGASDFALALTWAGRVSERVNYGITGRFISESIADETTTAMATDLGLNLHLPDNRTRAGLAVRNLGAQTKSLEGGDKEDLPITLAAGLSHHLREAPILFSAEVIKPSDDDVGGAFGVEVTAFRQMLVRAGYNTLIGKINTDSDKDKLAGLTLGLGFVFERLSVDYAFASYSELGGAHRFSIGSHF